MTTYQIVLNRIQHMRARLTASDPGLTRLITTTKATLSVMTSVFFVSALLALLDQGSLTVSIFAGAMGLLGVLVVFDDTRFKKQVTTALLPISAAISITAGAFLSQYPHASDVVILIPIFSAFYFSKFGSRYFSISMVSFISIYFSSILGVPFQDVPWFYLSILVGIGFAYLYNFIIIRDQPNVTLKRSLRSFHVQINLLFNLIGSYVSSSDQERQRKALKRELDYNAERLNEYAQKVSSQLSNVHPEEIWPGVTKEQLRIYLFDASMLIETLLPTMDDLLKDGAFQNESLQRTTATLLQAIRDIRALRHIDSEQQIQAAERRLEEFKQLTIETQLDSETFFLFNRLITMCEHVFANVRTLQALRTQAIEVKDRDNMEEDTSAEEEDDQEGKDSRMEPTTKKAIQAVAAGSVSIVLGYILTPSQQYWILLTAFIIFMGTDTVGRTFLKAVERTIGTVFGAIIGFVIAQFVYGHTYVEIGLIFLCIFMAFYFLPISYSFMMFWITMMVAMLYDLLLGGITWGVLGARVVDTIVGAALALAAAAYILPKKTQEKVSETTLDYFSHLNKLLNGTLQQLKGDPEPLDLTEKTFEMDETLSQLRTDAESMRKTPGATTRTRIEGWITRIATLNYYAKHLLTPTAEIDDQLQAVIDQLNEYINDNIDTIQLLLKDERSHAVVWDVEVLPSHMAYFNDYENNERKLTDSYHHFYYIRLINQTLVSFATDLGAQTERTSV
ncbi:FUSC family protein [Pontibacillus halophilus]|nr:FUSC family protein [Pontibacillus halophilus]